jgi:BASS family bile acid:Na+ symporter
LTLAEAINLLNIISLTALMLATGLQVGWEDVMNSAQDKLLMFKGVVANYLLVPAVAFGLLSYYHTDPMISAGFLVLAVCPGAPVGPPLASIAKGDVPLSIGLMIELAVLSAVLSPILLVALFNWLCPSCILHINFWSILRILLLSQLLPLIAGLCINKWASKVSNRIAKPLDKASKLLFLLVIVGILATQYTALTLVHLRGWIGMLILLCSSLGIGWIFGGRKSSSRKTMALTAACRNGGVGLAIVLSNCSGTPAVPAVVAYTLFSVLGSLATALIYRQTRGANMGLQDCCNGFASSRN